MACVLYMCCNVSLGSKFTNLVISKTFTIAHWCQVVFAERSGARSHAHLCGNDFRFHRRPACRDPELSRGFFYYFIIFFKVSPHVLIVE